ncbi:hypothetical protein EDB19DRAFT_1831816 [Suillus lakei]|nr:hypothetical protein EDB19DRAFT_1831816 [Suillus lakei]
MLLLLSHRIFIWMSMDVLPVAWYYLQTQEHRLHALPIGSGPRLKLSFCRWWLPMPRAVVLVLSTISTWSALLSIRTSRGVIYVCQHTGHTPKAQALAKPDADALSIYSLLVPGRQKLACSENLRCRPGLACTPFSPRRMNQQLHIFLSGRLEGPHPDINYCRRLHPYCLIGEAHYDLNQGQLNPIFTGRETH